VKPLLRVQYDGVVRRALVEDLGLAGDLTTDAIVPVEAGCSAVIVARRGGVVAGGEVAGSVFTMVDPTVTVDLLAEDGEEVSAGSPVLRISGSARAVLTGERTALNLLGRLSGIATLTRRFVEAVDGTGVRVGDTQKTTPSLRVLEKYAVRCVGGVNHRFGLDDAVLIKDNHLIVARGIGEAVRRVRERVGHTVKVEVEVDNLEQLARALAAQVDAVLLDNMDSTILRRAVEMAGGRVVLEASGGITLATVRAVAESGVDVISVGALTHSAPSLDLSLEVEG